MYITKINRIFDAITLIIGKSGFLEEKAHFFGNKTVDQPSGAN